MQTELTQPVSSVGAGRWGPPAAERAGAWSQLARILGAAAVFDILFIGGLHTMIPVANVLPLGAPWQYVFLLWPIAAGLCAAWPAWRLGARTFFAPVAVCVAPIVALACFLSFDETWVPWASAVSIAVICLPAVLVAPVAVPARTWVRWLAASIGVLLLASGCAAVLGADEWGRAREFDATVAQMRRARLATAAPMAMPGLQVEMYGPIDLGHMAYTVVEPGVGTYSVLIGGSDDRCSGSATPAVDVGDRVRTSLNMACVTLDGMQVAVTSGSMEPPVAVARLMERTDTAWLADRMVRRG